MSLPRYATELLYVYGLHSSLADGVVLSVVLTAVDDTTVLAVGYQTSGLATGRVAWLCRDTWGDGWSQERRMASDGLTVGVTTKGRQSRFSVAEMLPDIDALLDLVAWLRGDEARP